MNIYGIFVIIIACVVSGALVYVARLIGSNIAPLGVVPYPTRTTADIEDWNRQIASIREELASMTLAIAEGISRTDRAEKRVQKTVAAARRQLSAAGIEHAGLEAEHDELRERNDEPSGSSEVLPLFEKVEEPTRRTGIPGIDSQQLAEIRERFGNV